MTVVIDEFVDYLINKEATISNAVTRKAEECLEDYLSVTEAGAAKNRKKWSSLISILPEGKAKIFGCNNTTDGRMASLINGFNAHSLELDDGQRFAMIHLGASVISAIMASNDEIGFSKECKLKGIIMGYEAACRIAICMQPSHKKRGYHTAGTCGTIGSAVGVAVAMGMKREQLTRVITAALASSAGMLEIQEQSSEMKPYNLGRAAMDGLVSAYMGLSDFNVPNDMLGGERGFFKLFADSYDKDKLLSDKEYFEIERIYVKPYASCRHSHSAVEAAIKLRDTIDVNQIERVVVKTYSLGVKGHDHKLINGVASAKLSTPYAVAAALLYGRADLSLYEPLNNASIKLAQKIDVVEDEELTAECPAKRVAIVTVILNDGTEVSERIDYAKGEPENPMTKEEREQKKQLLVEYALRANKENEV
ncbi:2-methylcitrate dehydratase PrpD [Ruminococcaceae bacterium R-25]|nr:2-methylcitrate dehydratase PrpD [Ruminococcaceae bacterium R-25]SUQ11325.1 2-methylcitrate dehydratase PrpD [Oscillospiraceae bacterium]